MSGYGNAANVAENNRHESVRNRCIVMFTRKITVVDNYPKYVVFYLLGKSKTWGGGRDEIKRFLDIDLERRIVG